MSLIVGQESTPSAPSAGKGIVYVDSADGLPKYRAPGGAVYVLSPASPSRNALANGTFLFAQRQAPGTLTTYSNTSGRSYCADRWTITNENASAQYRRVDSAAAPETGLSARYYAELKKITSNGKVIFSQVIGGSETAQHRGRKVRLQFKAKNSVGSHTLRCALLYLTSSGTIDTIPATFASAFGAASTDPTWGTNLSAIVPSVTSSYSSIAGSGLSSVLTSSWRTYGGVFTVPTSALNIIAVLFTDGLMTAGDIVHLGEAGLFDGEEERSGLFVDFGEELRRCQHYYHKTFDLDVAPVQNIGSITGAMRWTAHAAGANVNRSPSFIHPVRMRAAPTATTYNPSAANTQARDSTASQDCSATTVQTLTEHGYAIVATGHSTSTQGNQLSVHITMEAEL